MANRGDDSNTNAPNAGPQGPPPPQSLRPIATTDVAAPVVQPPPAPTPPRRRSITEMLGQMLPASSVLGPSGPNVPRQVQAEGSGSGGTARVTSMSGVIHQMERKRAFEAGEGSSSGSRRPHPEQQEQQQQQQQQLEQHQQNVPAPPPPPPVPAPHVFQCIICMREFATAKGLFGHMRSHPDRGWRGAFPPPAFNREEFADVAGQVIINQEENDGGGVGPGAIDINQEPNAEDPQPPAYRLPDLNNPPPPED